MYFLNLFTDNYTPHAGLLQVDSLIVPRAGELVEDDEGRTYIVFDVAHLLQNGKMMVVVGARAAARSDRFYVLSENGHLGGGQEVGSPGCVVSDRLVEAVRSKLPEVLELS